MLQKIGVFDSGLGGLTVLDRICKYNPFPEICYFGDTARVPYGSRTLETIRRYALQDVRFLLSLNVEAIVIACGTVSANAIDQIRDRTGIPVYGVIDAAARQAVRHTQNGHVGVMGTAATVKSDAYGAMIRSLDPTIRVTSVPCPLLVPLIENGITPEDPLALMTAERYLQSFRGDLPDTIIMGCTHYPFYRSTFEQLLPGVRFIHMGEALSKELARTLPAPDTGRPPKVTYYVSEADTGFLSTANLYLENIRVDETRLVNIDVY